MGTSAALHQYIVQHTHEPQLLRELREETAVLFPQAAHMPVFPEQATFLSWLVAAIGARHTLEIGVFTGCSAIAVAKALPPDGTLFAVDRDPRSMAVAERYFAQAGVQHKITTRVAPAAAVLEELLANPEHLGRYDFAFVGTPSTGLVVHMTLLQVHHRCRQTWVCWLPGAAAAAGSRGWGHCL